MTTTPPPPIEAHADHRDRLLAHAREMIEAGDRLQASEKIWGAVAHGLKAVADERGWPYGTHADGGVIAVYIARQVGNRQIALLFRAIENLHRNFYDDVYEPEEIAERLVDAETLLSLLDDAHNAMPQGLEMPTAASYRNRVAKYAEEPVSGQRQRGRRAR